ncbi:hypothetical protein I6N95_08110 [Vagococcus sp. BWB3-3]|uniref:Uncharacterized protein n=1 Tax=Vagococcus allomyrinae TaxID=2794353 RepID=A0A940SUM6_9ENTE|nr:hypothetical protein [Vagococcus allomyrinae]MBP1040964.1 hypothetical protein [Vagococcus allomyrinae]
MSQQSKIVPVQLTDKPITKQIPLPKASLACKLTMGETEVRLYNGRDGSSFVQWD